MHFAFLGFVFLSSVQVWGAVSSPEIDYSNSEQIIVDRAIEYFEGKLTIGLNIPAVVMNARRPAGPTVLRAIAEEEARGTAALAIPARIDSLGRWEEMTAGNADFCLILFLRAGRSQAQPEKESTIAHETFHCFQFDQLGVDRTMLLPDWLIEGGAEFAGEDFSGGSNLGFERYADFFIRASSMPLFNLTYDSLPFFMHLNLIGSNQYIAMKRAWFQSGSEDAWLEWARTTNEEYLGKLAMGVKRKNVWGADWDLRHLDHIPNGNLVEDITDVSTMSVTYPTEQGRLKSTLITLPPNKFVKIRFEHGAGALRLDPWSESQGSGVGETFEMQNGSSQIFCYGDYCGCPAGAISYNTKISKDGMVLATALSAFQNGAIVIEETSPGCCPGAERLDPRFVGTWDLDYVSFLTGIYPAGFPGAIEQNVSGEHIVRIEPSGLMTKTFTDLKLFQKIRIQHDRYRRTELLNNGTVTACVSSRPTGPNRGWIEVLNKVDGVNYSETSIATGGDLQIHSETNEGLLVRWEAPGSTRGVFEFVNDSTVKVRGEARTFRKR